METPSIQELVPFLSERGVLEVDLALARYQITYLQQELASKDSAEVPYADPSE